jgi:hypothetical protein
MPEAATKQSPAFSCPFSAGAHAEKGHIYFQPRFAERRKHFMAFFNSAVGVLQTLIIALGAGLGIWGVMGYTVLLCFTLFKTGTLAKSVFNAH